VRLAVALVTEYLQIFWQLLPDALIRKMVHFQPGRLSRLFAALLADVVSNSKSSVPHFLPVF